MIIVDTNVLLYAVNTRARQHEAAHRWLTAALSGTDTVGFCWPVILGFVRVSTHPAIMPKPLRVEDAFAAVDSWLAARNAVVVDPTVRHRHILRALLTRSGAAGNLVTAAHIAALAIGSGATVASFDKDFERFDVEVVVPR
jgi:toxin-antitoxin system PIN domain toxin